MTFLAAASSEWVLDIDGIMDSYSSQAEESFFDTFNRFVELANSTPVFIRSIILVLLGLIIFRILINLL